MTSYVGLYQETLAGLKRRAKAETVSLRAIIYGTLRSSERQKVWSKDLFERGGGRKFPSFPAQPLLKLLKLGLQSLQMGSVAPMKSLM